MDEGMKDLSLKEVPGDNLLRLMGADMAVPDALGVNDHVRAMAALSQAPA